MVNLTEKELQILITQLKAEDELIQKYKQYSKQTQDLLIKNKCEQISAFHQKHYDTLFSFLKQEEIWTIEKF